MESYGLLSFREQASIPPMQDMHSYANGGIMHNIDGRAIKGGILTGGGAGGSAGYQLASMGYPGAQCSAFPLFAAVGNVPYELYGTKLVTNANGLVGLPGL